MRLNLRLLWGSDALMSWFPCRPGSATCLLWCDPGQGPALLCVSVSPVVPGSYQTLVGPCSFTPQSHSAPGEKGCSQLHSQKEK